MIKEHYSVVIIGAGPAGLSVALAVQEQGMDDILIIERDSQAGGVLNQCIHHGFGQHVFGEELTGPGYAARLIDSLHECNVHMLLGAMALNVHKDRRVDFICPRYGLRSVTADAVVLANGCRERTREAITIPGARCAGIYNAGTAQYLINMEGVSPGKKAVILGSGDIGLIMARRLTLEGAKVEAVLEKNPYSGGLQRNIQQCLYDFGIPLYLSTTVIQIIGDGRVEGVKVAQVDDDGCVMEDTVRQIECDTLLLSVGLIPETDIVYGCGIDIDRRTGGPVVDGNFQTEIEGIFACGNVAYVHDLVDIVTLEARKMAPKIVQFAQGIRPKESHVEVLAGENVAMVVPQRISHGQTDVAITIRSSRPLKNATISLLGENAEVLCSTKHQRLFPGESEAIALPDAPVGRRSITVHVQGESV